MGSRSSQARGLPEVKMTKLRLLYPEHIASQDSVEKTIVLGKAVGSRKRGGLKVT